MPDPCRSCTVIECFTLCITIFVHMLEPEKVYRNNKLCIQLAIFSIFHIHFMHSIVFLCIPYLLALSIPSLFHKRSKQCTTPDSTPDLLHQAKPHSGVFVWWANRPIISRHFCGPFFSLFCILFAHFPLVLERHSRDPSKEKLLSEWLPPRLSFLAVSRRRTMPSRPSSS